MSLMNSVHWTTIGAFWASVVIAIITVMATVINYLFFRANVDPNIIIYVDTDDKRPSLILLVVENIGKGLAKDISFDFSKPLPQEAWGLGPESSDPKVMDSGPLIHGIPALGPGAKRIINWGQFGGLHKYFKDEIINVTINYKSNRDDAFGTNEHKMICPIDIKSLEGTNAASTNWEEKAIKEIKRIGDILHYSTTGSRSFKVEIKEKDKLKKIETETI